MFLFYILVVLICIDVLEDPGHLVGVEDNDSNHLDRKRRNVATQQFDYACMHEESCIYIECKGKAISLGEKSKQNFMILFTVFSCIIKNPNISIWYNRMHFQ